MALKRLLNGVLALSIFLCGIMCVTSTEKLNVNGLFTEVSDVVTDNVYAVNGYAFTYVEYTDRVEIVGLGVVSKSELFNTVDVLNYTTNMEKYYGVFEIPAEINGKRVTRVRLHIDCNTAELLEIMGVLRDIQVSEDILFEACPCCMELYDMLDYAPWYTEQEDGLMYIGDMLIGYKGLLPADGNIYIKSGTKKISARLIGYKGIKHIYVNAEVESIGANFCEYDKVVFANESNIKYIEYNAFCECTDISDNCMIHNDCGLYGSNGIVYNTSHIVVNHKLITAKCWDYYNPDENGGYYSGDTVKVDKDIVSIEPNAMTCKQIKKIYIYNPDCEIKENGIYSDYSGVIYGYIDSTAEQYAESKGLVFKAIKSFTIGDVNDDGRITSNDALGVLQKVVSGDDTYIRIYDTDDDRLVTSADALRILQRVVGIA